MCIRDSCNCETSRHATDGVPGGCRLVRVRAGKPAEHMVVNREYAQGVGDSRGVYLKVGHTWRVGEVDNKGAPLAAYLFRRNVLIGLSFWGLLFANGLVHSAGAIAAGAYNTGLWSAAFLFVPLSVWVIYASAIRGPYSGKVVGVAYACGALTHVLLFMGYGLYKAGVFGNAGLLVLSLIHISEPTRLLSISY